jgi:hypothetical protein
MIRLLMGLVLAFLTLGSPAMATEEPAFEVVLNEGAFEVRDYPALAAAEVSVTGDQSEAANAGFRLLAGYIFGGNTRRQSIAMTAPVTQSKPQSEKIAMTAPVIQSGAEGAWIVRFIMPKGSTVETLPAPNDSRVKLLTIPASRIALVRFSGLTQPKDVQKRTRELESFLDARKYRALDAPALARFDPPWTLWFMRRNEIWVPIARDAAE